MLIWSKIKRDSSFVLKNQKNIKRNIDHLDNLKNLVDEFHKNISKKN